MKKHLTTFVVATALLASICIAGIRSAGKYSGVVIFDRWGGCTLYGGIYVMYISEAAKVQLRPEAGKCVQIDATQVEQPMNPGDGLIKQFKVLGAAPAVKEWESPEGLKLTVARAFEDGSAPEFIIRVENVGDKPATLHMDSLAPTILAAQTKPRSGFSPSDGPSVAVVTRQAFWLGGSDAPRMQSEGIDQAVSYRWWVTAPRALQQLVALQPKAAFELHVSFKLPQGEYEFLAGYGGGVHDGQCIASNLIGFDVRQDGSAVLAKAAGR
jgi:hypothetical protein